MTQSTSLTIGDIRIGRIVEREIPFVTPGVGHVVANGTRFGFDFRGDPATGG